MSSTATRERVPPEVWRVGFVVLIGVVMTFLDSTIVNVALDSVSVGLRMPLDVGQWTVTAYLLSLSAAIPVTTWAARRLGPRRLYLLTLLTFTVASALCGLATEPAELIIFRALQGVGGGMMIPVGQMIMVPATGPKLLPRVMGVFGIPVTFVPMIGPTVGGLILHLAGWRWIFLVNLPIGAIGLLLARRALPRDTADRTALVHRLDVVGLLLISPGMVLLTYGLTVAGGSASAGSWGVLTPLLAGVTLILLFVARSLNVRRPLLDLRIYRRSAVLSAASCTSLAMGAVLFGSTLLLPLYYQIVRGQGSMGTGLLMVPHGIGVAITTWLSGRVFERMHGATVLLGAVITLLASVPFVLFGATTPYWALGVATLIRGAGIGLANMPAMTVAFREVEGEGTAEVSTQINILQRFGGSLGIAVFVIIVHRNLGGGARAFALAHAAVLAAVAVALLSAVAIVVIQRRRGSAET